MQVKSSGTGLPACQTSKKPIARLFAISENIFQPLTRSPPAAYPEITKSLISECSPPVCYTSVRMTTAPTVRRSNRYTVAVFQVRFVAKPTTYAFLTATIVAVAADSALSLRGRNRSQRRHGLFRLLQQQGVLRRRSNKPHAALRPELGHRQAAGLDSRDHPVTVALLDQLVDRRHQQRILELARNPQRNRKIGRTDHRDVHAGNGKQFFGALHRRDSFELDHRQGVQVLVLDDLGEAARFIFDHRRVDAVAALAHWRKTHPAQGFAQDRRIFQDRKST